MQVTEKDFTEAYERFSQEVGKVAHLSGKDYRIVGNSGPVSFLSDKIRQFNQVPSRVKATCLGTCDGPTGDLIVTFANANYYTDRTGKPIYPIS